MLSAVRLAPPVVGLVGGARRSGGVILRYHSVSDDQGWAGEYIQRSLVTPPEVFDRQMAHISSRYRVVPLSEIARSLKGGESVDRRCVAVTFDDGYEDNYRNAFPILRRHGLPATFFVTTGCVGARPELWTVRLRRALMNTRLEELRLSFTDSLPLPLRTAAERETAIKWLTGLVKRCGRREAEETIGEVLAVAGEPSSGRRTMMNWDEMREMAAAGMSIGAHTVSHYNLPSLDDEAADGEIMDSKRELEGRLEREVEHFAYPNGRTSCHCDVRTARLVERAGFSCAVTSVAGPASRRFSRFALPRLGVVPRDSDPRRFEADIQYARAARVRDASIDAIRRDHGIECSESSDSGGGRREGARP